MLMDEPTANPDLGNQMRVHQQVRLLVRQGRGVMMPSHVPDHAFSCCSKAAILGADVLFMTGAVLVNGTFEELMGYPRNARVVGMFGPSAQILPDFLIDKRVHYITTSVLKDPEALFDRLTESVVEGRWGDYTEPRVVWTKGGF